MRTIDMEKLVNLLFQFHLGEDYETQRHINNIVERINQRIEKNRNPSK